MAGALKLQGDSKAYDFNSLLSIPYVVNCSNNIHQKLCKSQTNNTFLMYVLHLTKNKFKISIQLLSHLCCYRDLFIFILLYQLFTLFF